MIKRKTLFSSMMGIFLLMSGSVTSVLADEISLNGVTYIEAPDGWYAKGDNRLFKVIGDSISARLIDREDRRSAIDFFDRNDLTLVRENRLNIMDIRVSGNRDVMETIKDLIATGFFRYVEPNVIGEFIAIPNDTGFTNCWGLHNTGQSGGTADADMDVVEAWDVETGDPGIVVAILDSGAEVTHQDLSANIWSNPLEIPGNGIDDDSNGYIDDIVGWDFENNDNNPIGTNYHGTHVSGCVAASNNNGIGSAGVAGGWGASPGASLMICMIGTSGPLGEILDDAILYAADNGARIITMSLSVSQSSAINDALDYASNTAGCFIDCASGNDYGSIAYPANNVNVCAVGATDRDDARADFSNFGPQLELTAPGVDIYSTQLDNSYGTSSGTSFAAPYVAGVAALILSAAPSLTNQEVRELMWNTADDLGTAGFDNYYGYGRVNAHQALLQTSGVYLDRPAYSCQGNMAITVRDNSAAGSVQVEVSSDSETVPELLTLTEVGSGVFTGLIELGTIAAQPGDSILSVSHDDVITVFYSGLGISETAGVDCLSPSISNVTIGMVTDSEAVISFTTSELCYGSVTYGTPEPALVAESSQLTTSHAITLTGLDDCVYHEFFAGASDPAGNSVTDDNGGNNFNFVTYERVELLNEPMNSNPGWTISGGQWSFGQPAGSGGDPTSGATGTSVYGYNLNGAYANNIPEYHLTTPALDCSDAVDTRLSFYRWLGVENSTWDHAYVRVSNNGTTWVTIWQNGSSSMSETAWTLCEYDISAVADGQAAVYVRWTMGTTDSSVVYSGWNIDDVTVSYVTPCEVATPTPDLCIHDGDVDGSATLTAGDAQMAFHITLGLITPTFEQECAADCSNDGSVTAGDAQQIFYAVLGQGECFDPL